MFETFLLLLLFGPCYQMNLRAGWVWPWLWMITSSRRCLRLSTTYTLHRTDLAFLCSSEPMSQALQAPPPPLDKQVVATSNPRGSVRSLVILDHRKNIKALYEAFMGAFKTNCHVSVPVRFHFDTIQDRYSRDASLYLYHALVEQWKICLAGASSLLGLIHRQAVETATLVN